MTVPQLPQITGINAFDSESSAFISGVGPGFKVVRYDCQWVSLQPGRTTTWVAGLNDDGFRTGSTVGQNFLDGLATKAIAGHYQIYACLDYGQFTPNPPSTVGWPFGYQYKGANTCPVGREPDFDNVVWHLADYMTRTYPDPWGNGTPLLMAIELNNEPDNVGGPMTVANYNRIIQNAWSVVKTGKLVDGNGTTHNRAAYLNVPIVAGCSGGGNAHLAWTKAVIDYSKNRENAGKAQTFDHVSYHPYTTLCKCSIPQGGSKDGAGDWHYWNDWQKGTFAGASPDSVHKQIHDYLVSKGYTDSQIVFSEQGYKTRPDNSTNAAQPPGTTVWSATKAYVVGDEVTHSGPAFAADVFYCTAANTGHAPPNTTYWQEELSCTRPGTSKGGGTPWSCSTNCNNSGTGNNDASATYTTIGTVLLPEMFNQYDLAKSALNFGPLIMYEFRDAADFATDQENRMGIYQYNGGGGHPLVHKVAANGSSTPIYDAFVARLQSEQGGGTTNPPSGNVAFPASKATLTGNTIWLIDITDTGVPGKDASTLTIEVFSAADWTTTPNHDEGPATYGTIPGVGTGWFWQQDTTQFPDGKSQFSFKAKNTANKSTTFGPVKVTIDNGGAQSTFTVGLATGSNTPDPATDVPNFVRANCGHVRTSAASWQGQGNPDGSLQGGNAFNNLDAYVKSVNNAGMKLILGCNPGGAPYNNNMNSHTTAFATFCINIAKRYQAGSANGVADIMEIGNDVNGANAGWDSNPNPAEYARLMRLIYQGFQTIGPGGANAPLLTNGGFGGSPRNDASGMSGFDWVKGLYASATGYGAGFTYDLFNSHRYTWPYTPTYALANSFQQPRGWPVATVGVKDKNGNIIPLTGMEAIRIANNDANSPHIVTEFGAPSPPYPNWVSGHAYHTDDIVVSGDTYQCKSPVTSSTPPPSDGTHWTDIGSGGSVAPSVWVNIMDSAITEYAKEANAYLFTIFCAYDRVSDQGRPWGIWQVGGDGHNGTAFEKATIYDEFVRLTTWRPVSGPRISSLAPASDVPAGGKVITVVGTGLTGATEVDVDGISVAFTPDGTTPDTKLTFTTQAHVAGTVPVHVITPGGTSNDLSFTFANPQAPTVTSIVPASGDVAGGPPAVTVNGARFVVGATTFAFGGPTNLATSVTVAADGNSATMNPPPAPGGATGVISVIATTSHGSSPDVNDSYTYTSSGIPIVTSISSTGTNPAGGDTLTVNGSGFTGVLSVKIGANPCTGVTPDVTTPDLKLTCTTPAGTAGGTFHVKVTNASGPSAGSAADKFTYSGVIPPGAPTVTSVSPNTGPAAGGKPKVTVGGTNLGTATDVQFNGVSGTGLTLVDAQTVKIIPPAGTGTVDVQAVNPIATSALNSPLDQYTYNSVSPSVSSISSTGHAAAGGDTLTVNGSGFYGSSQFWDIAVWDSGAVWSQAGGTATSVTVNGNPVLQSSVTVISDIKLTCTTPAGAPGSSGHVEVTTDVGTSSDSAADVFTYTGETPSAPSVTGLSPASGPAAGGGSPITITGTNLDTVTGVTFGGVIAAFTLGGTTTMTATPPAGTAGTIVEVRATNPGGQSPLNPPGDQYEYIGVPTITKVAPAGGPAGVQVLITGTNLDAITSGRFGNAAIVTMDTADATATTITVTAPVHADGKVSVFLSNSSGESATSPNAKFTYGLVVPPPVLTSMDVHAGPTTGGTVVTIGGTSLAGATEVDFGTVASPRVEIDSDLQIKATSPAMAASSVDVRVITAGGTSAITAEDAFLVAQGPVFGEILPPDMTVVEGNQVMTVQVSDSPDTTLTVSVWGGDDVPYGPTLLGFLTQIATDLYQGPVDTFLEPNGLDRFRVVATNPQTGITTVSD